MSRAFSGELPAGTGRFEISVHPPGEESFSSRGMVVIEDCESYDISLGFPESIGAGYIRRLNLCGIGRIYFLDAVFREKTVIEDFRQEESVHISIMISGRYSSADCTGITAGKCLISYNPLVNDVYSYFPATKTEHIMFQLRPEYMDKIIQDPELRKLLFIDRILNHDPVPPYSFITGFVSWTLPLIEQIKRCFYVASCEKDIIKDLVDQLMAIQMIALRERPGAKEKSTVLRNDDIRKILLARDILLKRISEPPSLVDLALEAGINEFKLKKGFREVFGCTVFEYLRARRMEMAHDMLKSGGMKIIDVAYATGYSNPSHFAVRFRETFGVNPGEYIFNTEKKREDEVTGKTENKEDFYGK